MEKKTQGETNQLVLKCLSRPPQPYYLGHVDYHIMFRIARGTSDFVSWHIGLSYFGANSAMSSLVNVGFASYFLIKSCFIVAISRVLSGPL